MKFIEVGNQFNGESGETRSPVLKTQEAAKKILEKLLPQDEESRAIILEKITDVVVRPEDLRFNNSIGLKLILENNINSQVMYREDEISTAMRMGLFEHYFGLRPILESGEPFQTDDILYEMGRLVVLESK